MCTLFMALDAHPRYRLVLAANRDEYYDRSTAPAGYWWDLPGVFAGRDLVHGGTWLGVTTGGRLAALTNYREPRAVAKEGQSRGRVVSDFLQGDTAAQAYLESVRERGASYSGFNLVLGDRGGIYYYSNRSERVLRLGPGIYGLSNHLLDTPWPKVTRGKEALARALAAPELSEEELFLLLADRSRPPDDRLPDTGVGRERERMLSSIFIESEHYGTRSSTLLLVDREGKASFIERSFDGGSPRDTRASFDWSR